MSVGRFSSRRELVQEFSSHKHKMPGNLLESFTKMRQTESDRNSKDSKQIKSQVAARLNNSAAGWALIRREHELDDLPGSDVTIGDLRRQLDRENL